ncbi:UNKNOWN [Stylonychia lemnae]|uniref:Autophagy-related protein n=1 Tax=Stylonychia lemnae TaxID=5949 RepID=A0A078B3B0_STYLE|nr:UNKNOWN [Stylonychia lemnae]|eukprot:CDW87988.1 UNKNOWN [Stylonychia lemnae]
MKQVQTFSLNQSLNMTQNRPGQLPPLYQSQESTEIFQIDKFISEGVDHYRNLFSFMIESINQQVIDNQKIIGKFFYRFHVSDDLTIGELSEIIKFKINSKIREEEEKLSQKERIIFFNNRLSCSETLELKEVYDKMRESDGWLYMDFLIEVING